MDSFIRALHLLMGWSACTGSLSAGSVLLGAIIFSWKILGCNALSWTSRTDYSRVGYRMTSVIDFAMCRRTALRYSVGLLVLCSCAPLLNLTSWTFAFDSFSLHCYLIYHAWKFHEDSGNQSSQELFRFSLIYLLALLFLMLAGKKYSSKDDKHEIAS
ncbi:Protoheme IX farnesyltransferase, mitochondrial [Araneus ventricosus]|uniref:Heme O synthase n=1 Tax=Araneus ventricosus TaxID=182803 RepID=A0A4Y2FHA1_ARAVE|nr:Protoheme IX farnesyltransferase, mitochondrial [Araneus ventricosus]